MSLLYCRRIERQVLFVLRTRQYHSHPVRHLRWVPEAYRGAAKKRPIVLKGRPPAKEAQETKAPIEREKRKSRKDFKEQKIRQKEERSIKNKEDRLMGLHQDLVRLAQEYRQVFSSESLAPKIPIKGITGTTEEKQEEKKASLQAVAQQIREVLNDIHQADTPVDWERIEKSEDLFRGLCRLLQDMIKLSAGLYECKQNTDMGEYIDLAELALRNLHMFASERELVVESARNWSSKVATESSFWWSAKAITESSFWWGKKGSSLGLLSSVFPREDDSSRSKGWANSLLDGLPEDGSSDKEQEQHKMAHNDPEIGVTQELLRTVMQSIMSGVQEQIEDLNENAEQYQEDDVDRTAFEKPAKRMVELLDSMPRDILPDADIIQQVLDMLRRVGTLESARECSQIFHKHPANQHRLRFSLVLQAYLEAVKHEEEIEEQESAVIEALGALKKQWNENLPHHRVERIMHCSIVLNCMCITRTPGIPDICEKADHLIKRAIGRQAYAELQKNCTSGKGKVDSQILPLINFRTQIYALSEKAANVEKAKQMLEYMLKYDKEGTGRFIVYPNVETFNAVLTGIVSLIGPDGSKGDKKKNDSEEGDDIFEYSMSLLDYMLSRAEPVRWPNDTTFSLLFSLLKDNSSDAGERGEEIQSKMAIRETMSQSGDVKVTLSVYHRVLGYWLEIAKQVPPVAVGASERAMRLLDKLEMLSLPLLLDAQNVSRLGVSELYDYELCPSRRTYRLVLNVCAATKHESEYEMAADIAFEVSRRMVSRGLPIGSDVSDLLLQCYSRLPEQSNKRKELELQVQSTLVSHSNLE